MGADDAVDAPTSDGDGAQARSGGRARRGWAATRALIRIAYRDPEHVAERVTLYAADRLGEASRAWAEETRRARPDTSVAVLAAEQRTESAKVARLDGAVAGTPFFIALVPGYMSYLWQEARMGLRTAALYGRDPAGLQTAAEMLALRGVHPTPDAAEEALTAVRDSPQPGKPSERRPLRTWIRSGYLLLVFGGFLSAPDDEAKAPEAGHTRLRALGGMVLGGVVWLATWVFPVTLMIAMAWGCESHARQLGRRLLVFYDGEAASAEAAIAEADKREDEGHDRRAVLRAGALALSVIVPIVFIALVDHERQSTGMNWLGALGALVALSLVVAITVIANRK